MARKMLQLLSIYNQTHAIFKQFLAWIALGIIISIEHPKVRTCKKYLSRHYSNCLFKCLLQQSAIWQRSYEGIWISIISCYGQLLPCQKYLSLLYWTTKLRVFRILTLPPSLKSIFNPFQISPKYSVIILY